MGGKYSWMDNSRVGWFKIFISEPMSVFAGMLCGLSEISLSPLMYGKIDSEPTAFDLQLGIPFLAIDRAVLVQVISGTVRTSDVGASYQVLFFPLSKLSAEQQNRCYIPVSCVTCIVPVRPEDSITVTLVQITSEDIISGSRLVLPGPKILDISEKLDKPSE